jgi:hypothetical protein
MLHEFIISSKLRNKKNFVKKGVIFSRLLTVAAPIRAARVSKRFPDTSP